MRSRERCLSSASKTLKERSRRLDKRRRRDGHLHKEMAEIAAIERRDKKKAALPSPLRAFDEGSEGPCCIRPLGPDAVGIGELARSLSVLAPRPIALTELLIVDEDALRRRIAKIGKSRIGRPQKLRRILHEPLDGLCVRDDAWRNAHSLDGCYEAERA